LVRFCIFTIIKRPHWVCQSSCNTSQWWCAYVW